MKRIQQFSISFQSYFATSINFPYILDDISLSSAHSTLDKQ